MNLDSFSMDRGPYQRRLDTRFLYLLLIWHSLVLHQLVLGKATLSPRSFGVLGKGQTEGKLVDQVVTGQRFRLLGPPRKLIGNDPPPVVSSPKVEVSKSLKRRPTFKQLIQNENFKNAQIEEAEEETLAIEKLYKNVMHPPDHRSPKTYEPFRPKRRAPKKLKSNQIHELGSNELIHYISNFNEKVELSKERWKEAERLEEVALGLLYQKAANFFTNHLKPEDREVALKNKLKQLREFVKSRAPNDMDDKELQKRVLKHLVTDQGWTSKEVEFAHRQTQELKQEAFWLARKYISSGMKLLDRIKFSMRKFFNFKFSFKWPWKK